MPGFPVSSAAATTTANGHDANAVSRARQEIQDLDLELWDLEGKKQQAVDDGMEVVRARDRLWEAKEWLWEHGHMYTRPEFEHELSVLAELETRFVRLQDEFMLEYMDAQAKITAAKERLAQAEAVLEHDS